MIRDNYREIIERIKKACDRSGRNTADVTLIAVSKTKPVDMIREAVEAGAEDLGENKPQELRDKYDQLPYSLRWHMIGHLQKNKVKYVVGRACMIHSVDNLELAGMIDKEAEKKDIVMPVLVEVNMAGEESKDGLRPEQTEDFIRQIAVLKHITVRGLMTIAPETDEPENNRIYFRKLRELSIDIENEKIDNVNMCELSMGMTGDFEVAVEEGATMVRVGTGIFGARQYGVSAN